MSQSHAIPALLFSAVVWLNLTCSAAVNQVEQVAPGVYFHEGDLEGKGHCNSGWVVFDDFVLVIDANMPSGARELIPKIKAVMNRSERNQP
jgi:hypothetical protein